MRVLIVFFRSYPWESAIVVTCLVGANLLDGVGLATLLPLINGVVEGGVADVPGPAEDIRNSVNHWLTAVGITPSIGSLLVLFFLVVTLKNVVTVLANRQVGYTVARIATDLRLRLLRALLTARWEYFLRQQLGRLATAVGNEAARSGRAYMHGVEIVSLFLRFLVYGGVALMISWQVTLISLVTAAGVLGIAHRYVGKARRAGKQQTKIMKTLMARLADTIQAVKQLKSMGREGLMDAVLASETESLNRTIQQQILNREILSAVVETQVMAVAAIAIYVLLVELQMPLAEALILVLVMKRIITTLGKIQKNYQDLAILSSAVKSLREVTRQAEEESEVLTGTRAPELSRAIRLNDIQFAYGSKPILTGLSLEVPVGRFTTLVGPSGAGKTTVIDLVIGLLRPQQGTITIDDTPLTEIDMGQWRRAIGYVPQDNFLLHDTVLNNVTLGDATLNKADAVRALKSASAWDFVESMEQGIHTVVGERGAKLSGGQRQRVLIARALAHHPRVLILDEPTSALDPRSVATICTTLRGLRGDLTILAITHQPELVAAADRVYRLEGGQAHPEDDHGDGACALPVPG